MARKPHLAMMTAQALEEYLSALNSEKAATLAEIALRQEAEEVAEPFALTLEDEPTAV